ncbi:MAG: hypothetical protein HRT71_21970 [Flavobacteriales bacterium]|nr:hypothetical protein [Flavobacteriales bacterium]
MEHVDRHIMDLFLSHEKEALLARIIALHREDGIPIQDIIIILQECTDMEISGALLSLLEEHVSSISEDLMLAIQDITAPFTLRFQLMTLILENPGPATIDFTFSQYISEPRFRAQIENRLCLDPDTLLLALAQYIEKSALSDKDTQTITPLLGKIPTTTYVKHAPDLTLFKISDLYHKLYWNMPDRSEPTVKDKGTKP